MEKRHLQRSGSRFNGEKAFERQWPLSIVFLYHTVLLKLSHLYLELMVRFHFFSEGSRQRQETTLVHVEAPILVATDNVEGEWRPIPRSVLVSYYKLEDGAADRLPLLEERTFVKVLILCLLFNSWSVHGNNQWRKVKTNNWKKKLKTRTPFFVFSLHHTVVHRSIHFLMVVPDLDLWHS